ncbi:hypothetical protein GCM10010329_77120 [Streptomyces spiroverticillatus]|uniref:Uncharacterized protein n=1 Tax=Streptomyces finlayi TaxID=67296 RepID=A0A918X643_9ACTN|nr:hypothetical protein [Streptomyces finlayi]GHA42809.1 hypothetical protein GCM10010329_77120 [Streptomyces spiroverticillatus]GHD13846.1 hypothetical protein GCM10010334_72530 [Streptomyces finlayi]
MSSQEWTIDGIAHALGVPDQRMQFLRDINLTPLPDLPAVLDRWVRHVSALEAAKPAIESLRAAAAVGEELPAALQHDDDSAGVLEGWRDQARAARQGRGAA